MPVIGGNQIDHNALILGQVVDLQLCNTVSKLNKSQTSIPYGLGVVTSGDDGAILPSASSTAQHFIGVVRYELNRARQDGESGAPAEFDMSVITQGVVAVEASVSVVKDDPVFLIVGDGSGTSQGKFSNVVGATDTLAVEITGAKWVATTATGGVGKISLGLGG